jgi:ABC-type polysaccharide/polyol phosphate export permease
VTATPGTAAVPVPSPARVPARPGTLAELFQFRQLVALLVSRELKVRYKRSVLGLVWTMLNPLLLMVVYTVVFTTIMPVAMPDFSVFLLAGLLPWLFVSTSILQGMSAVLGNQELIRKIRLPQAVFPLSVVGSNLVNFVLSVLPLLGVMLVIGHPLTPALFFLPVAAALLCCFAAGLTLIFSSATVFFRDVRHLTEVMLQILFYLTPVLYAPEQIGQGKSSAAWWLPAFRGVLEANPLTYLLPLVRDPVYRGALPPLEIVGAATAWAVVSLVAGYTIFRKLEPRHIHHF